MREKNGEHPLGDAGQLVLFILFLVIWAGDSFFLHGTTFLAEPIPLLVRLVLFGLALAAAILLSQSGHVVVQHGARPQHVVVSGAFHYVRHPLYLAAILAYLGLSVLTASLIALAMLIGIFVFYNYIASYEEALLETKFGEQYRQYKLRTGKWLPRI